MARLNTATSRRLQLAVGGALASGALLFSGSAGVASAEPAPAPSPGCFGLPICLLPGFEGGGGYATGNAGGGYATGEAGGGYATGEAGGAASRGQAGGAFNHAE
ncbi:hypothetical protein [Mycolicibacterium lacusdiani]|uniref:hypothetical protein n=1 Tax=Mycolicibacterium lacusdiani TaxID=2895283 RepID=UPI001F34BA4A|nr:hypothetical protein [Mycolicibacterium lacusdiani]